MNATLEKLSKLENFQSWRFERYETWEEYDAAPQREDGRAKRYPLGTEGPWLDEPDKVQWVDPTTGYDCLIVRNNFGALCGYVGVPEGHPFHAKSYGTCIEGCLQGVERGYCDHTPEGILNVHGGITFSGFCDPSERADSICHVVNAEGRPEKVWWLGFDCAHAFDLAPGMAVFEEAHGLQSGLNDTYRDLEYVVDEVTNLAAQCFDLRGVKSND